MESRIEITKAIINVMKEVKNIEKNLNVGSGQSSYKGVADKDVKLAIGQAMENNGLAMIPISINPKVTVERWEETNNYGTKMKTQVFTEVLTKYLLLHESGESLEIEGYGHGIDSQDKSAGKATTYALKYALLYTFLVPTGDIDDADKTHSNNIESPKKQVKEPEKELPFLNKGTENWNKVIKYINDKQLNSLNDVKKHFKMSKEVAEELITIFEKTI